MATIQQVQILDIATDASRLQGLVALLQNSVDTGASVGFLAPLAAATATAYWQGVAQAIGQHHVLWVAEQDDQVVGSVQLSICAKENGRHRAEVQKLFVLDTQRGQGIARALMDTLEAFARSRQLSLLVLDTLAGTGAEQLYQRLDWQRVGEIPHYAADPFGAIFPTALYYKLLSPVVPA
ncbi:GNAT family N-acetyltransferase [Rhodoferax sp.]|uniref:GNAT family N-acetyltransferase n=1 Tax=Rhodoferax sp. TaxID=50421 RepID=UPI00374CB73B